MRLGEEENIGKEKEDNCWNCYYRQKGGMNLFGYCNYFSEYLDKEKKEIPVNVVDIGCGFFLDDELEKHPLLDVTVDLFNGKKFPPKKGDGNG